MSDNLLMRPASWRVSGLIPATELSYPGRIVGRCVMIGIQISLYYWLWKALYTAGGSESAQTVTYSALAVLLSRVRWTARSYSRESIPARIREGTIAYWFVRPLEARQYYLIRGVGEIALGGSIALLGFLVCLAVGIVRPPDSAAAGVLSLIGIAVGQIILYYLGLLLDLVCFWMVTNDSMKHIYAFAQDLLSGALLPLWLFPSWLNGLASVLPFKAAIYSPLSLYVGREPVASSGYLFAVQFFWCAVLAVCARVLWRRASFRIMVQGG
ncbi:ABC-2 family transporter protein [Streptomyces sp. NBC_00247]|uniref:ABC transporter permease n=1 Tax=Streptomyces sp. NBC_00247 TaxID=2975689 RepID=UPI002E2DE389|nr:ABC-2 family transporter protein [Streptomyces sp. NBC_00247]